MRNEITEQQILDYIRYRREHLKIEKQKIPFSVIEKKRSQAIKKLEAKIFELSKLREFMLRGDFKETIEYEKNKAEYLKSKKIYILKKLNKEKLK